MSEEEEETPRQRLLRRARRDLQPRNIVAFLGPPNSGKTVIATLIRDSIYSHFLETYKDEFEVNMVKGYEFLKASTDMMLEGKFPSPTLPNTEGEVIFNIYRKGPLAKGIHLIIRDISGEDYESLCVAGDIHPLERVESVLRRGKTRSMRYGPLSFIVYAKMYVVMIDCSLYEKWKKYELDYSHLLNSLLDFQRVVGKDSTKIISSIAVVLTKTDCLPLEKIDVSAKELIAKSMPQFDKTLGMLHSGACDYFKLSIDTQRNSENEKVESGIKIPWAYSSDEYERLLLWIISNIS